MKLLTNEQHNIYQKSKICYICKEKFEDKIATDKQYCEIRDHFIIQDIINVVCTQDI